MQKAGSMCQGLLVSELIFISKMDKKGVKWVCETCVREINSAIEGNEPAKLTSLAENITAKNKLNNIEKIASR